MTKELWKQLKQNNSFSQTHWPTFTILTFDVLLSLISWRISFLSAPFFVFSQLLLCLALFHSYLILHEAAHSAVAQNRSVNDLVGQICGWFLFMPFLSRQSSHLLHHTWAGHPRRDPANNRMIQKFSVITPKEVKHLEFVWKYWFPAIIINDRIGLWRAPFQQSDSGLKSPRVKSEIRWAYLYAAFYFLVGSFILFSGSAQHFFLWYLPALFVCFLVEELANLPHHAETKLLDDSAAGVGGAGRASWLRSQSCAQGAAMTAPTESKPAPRKRYDKPAVRSSALFERRSLSCGIQPSDPDVDPSCGTFHQSV